MYVDADAYSTVPDTVLTTSEDNQEQQQNSSAMVSRLNDESVNIVEDSLDGYSTIENSEDEEEMGIDKIYCLEDECVYAQFSGMHFGPQAKIYAQLSVMCKLKYTSVESMMILMI